MHVHATGAPLIRAFERSFSPTLYHVLKGATGSRAAFLVHTRRVPTFASERLLPQLEALAPHLPPVPERCGGRRDCPLRAACGGAARHFRRFQP